MSISNQTQEESNDRKIFVTSIPKQAGMEDIYAHFSQYGSIVSISPFFKIGRGSNISTVIEFKENLSRGLVLNDTHRMFNRYLDCKEYLRGEKLKQRNLEMKRKNVYLTNIGPNLQMKDLKKFFSNFGKIFRVKVGYSIKGSCRYGILFFESEKSATEVLKRKFYSVEGYDVEVRRYQERVHVQIKKNEVERVKKPNRPRRKLREFRPEENENITVGWRRRDEEISRGKTEEEGELEEFRKNDEDALVDVRMVSFLHLRQSHSFSNLRMNCVVNSRFNEGGYCY